MQPAFFIGVGTITLIFTIFRLMITRAKKPYKQELEKYIERDRQSNFIRKKNIPEELFISPDISRIPLREYPETGEYKFLLNKQIRCERAAKQTMMKPMRGMSNIDLKMEYGAANLETITAYEENYNKYLHSLIDLAKEMIKLKFYDDAETVLRESLDIGSDLTLSYKLLADVFFAQGRKAVLESLYAEIESDDTKYAENPGLKNSITSYIDNIIKNYDALREAGSV